MLIQFNFGNFKSFRDEVSLDMTATQMKEHSYNLITGKNNERYLKVSAIYGANNSGKSNVLEAYDFMRYLVLLSFKNSTNHQTIPVKRFAFSRKSKQEPSTFEVIINYKEKEYQYGFSIDNKKVISEWLNKRDFRSKNKYNELFYREHESIHCSNQLKGASNFIPMVEENTLFLSIISNAKIPYAKDISEWFDNTRLIDFGDVEFENIISRVLPPYVKEKKFQKDLIRFFNAIDIPVHDFRIEKIKTEDSDVYRIYSRYQTEDGIIELPFTEESSGTQKMLTLFTYLRETFDHGNTVWVDELDAKLHPLLLRYVINMFHNEEINKKGAQLIYTTHDNYTLSKEIFRRDQVWFVEKREDKSSDLYSLAEYKLGETTKKVRNDATFNKDYITGRYGAVPVLKGFDM